MLGALVTLHEVIFGWSTETSMVTQLCETPVEAQILDDKIEKLGQLFNEKRKGMKNL